jgi:hypothetical protein
MATAVVVAVPMFYYSTIAIFGDEQLKTFFSFFPLSFLRARL